MCVVCALVQGRAWLGLAGAVKSSYSCAMVHMEGKAWLGLAVAGKLSDGFGLVCDHEKRYKELE